MSVHKEQSFLNLLREGGNTGMWSYSPVTQQLDADANTCKLMQCTDPSPTCLAQMLACVHPDDRALLEQDLHAAVSSKGACTRTFRVQAEGTTTQLTLRARWCALPDSGGGALLGVVERSLLPSLQAQAIEQRFEQWRNALVGSPVVIYEQDAQLLYEWVLAPRVGLDMNAITGHLASDFLEPECAAEIDRIKRRVMDSGSPERRRVHIRSKSGEGGDFDVYLAPRRGSDGQVNGLMSVAIDVAKPNLREQQLLTVFESAPVPISLSRLSDGVFIQVNTQFLELFGYSLKEVLGSGALGLNLWHQAEDRNRMLAELKANGQVRNLVTGYRHKSGRIGRVQMSVELVEVGGEMLLLAVLTDISALEEARRSLAQSEARYKVLSEASFEGVGLARDGIVVDANEQIARMLGVPREQLIGKPVTHNMRRADVPRALQAFHTGGDSNNEYEYLRPDGSKVILEVNSKDLVQDGEVRLGL